MAHEIITKQILTDEDLDYIVDAAVNHCGHWCDRMEYGKEPNPDLPAMSSALSYGGTLVFSIDVPFEEGGKTSFELTTKKLIKGIKSHGGIDLDSYDGPIADDILQRALFGEVIYG